MTDCLPAAPAQGAWYDLDTVVYDVLDVLRLREEDLDRARVETLVPVAAEQINIRLDRVNELLPAGTTIGEGDDEELDPRAVTPDILQALRDTTVELYLRRRTGTVSPGAAFPDVEAVDVAAPGLDTGHKSRWGMA